MKHLLFTFILIFTYFTSFGIGPVTGPASVCQGSSATLYDATIGGTWSSSNTTVATIGSGGVVFGVSAGTATITYVASGAFATLLFTVNPTPTSISGSNYTCVGDITIMSDTTSGGAWTSSNTAVAIIGTSGVVTAVSIGTTIISYTLGTGCSSMETVFVGVTPGPIRGSGTICVGSSVTLTDGSGNWSSSNTAVATIGSTGLLTGVSAGTTLITFSLGAGCTAIAVENVVITPDPITGLDIVCIPAPTTSLSDGSVGGSWSSSNIAVATVGSLTGVVTGITTGSCIITYDIATGYMSTLIMIAGVCESVPQVAGNAEMKIYPNPASNELRVDAATRTEAQFEIVNQLGQTMLTGVVKGWNASIPVGILLPGIYVFILRTDEGKVTRRFMKE